MFLQERWEASTAGGVLTRRTRIWGTPGGTPSDPRSVLVRGTYVPGPTTTGPLPGTTFTQVTTPTTFTTAQAVTGVEFCRRVVCAAAVTFTDCIFHGEPTATAAGSRAAVIGSGALSLHGSTFTDCLFDRTGPYTDNQADCIDGTNFTALRCELKGSCDGIGLTDPGYGASIMQCWIHDMTWMAASYQSDGWTHNDGVQFHRGGPHYVGGNLIGGYHDGGNPAASDNDDAHNSCLMIQQEVSALTVDLLGPVLVELNWLQGGMAAVNLGYKNSNNLASVTVQNNVFLPQSWYPPGAKTYYITRASGVAATLSGNVLSAGGAVPIGAW